MEDESSFVAEAGAAPPNSGAGVGTAAESAWTCVGWLASGGLEKDSAAGGEEIGNGAAARAGEFGVAWVRKAAGNAAGMLCAASPQDELRSKKTSRARAIAATAEPQA
ncbi:MAG: hypothetical protein ABSG98_02250 [Anaerolineales bacterium]|jgi:hypothetical protein